MNTRYKNTLILSALFIWVAGFLPVQSLAQPFPETKLTAVDGAAYDYFGWSVSLSGDRALVGAYRDDDKGASSGSAYVLGLQNGTWTEVAKLTASDGVLWDEFGYSVSLSGDRALVGASRDGDKGSDSGSAYVFELQNGTWTEVAKLTASDGAPYDYFGSSVSLFGDRALVGAWGDLWYGEDTNKGAAYIFELQNGTWTEVAKLTASDWSYIDYFGWSVSLFGDRALVGDFWDDGLSGSVYVFELQSGTWAEVARLTASDGALGDQFGRSVSLSNNRALVGAWADDDNGQTSGSASVFELRSGTWTEVAKLTASDGTQIDGFGWSVSLSGDRAMVGALRDDDKGSDSGSAYVFELQNGTWTEVAKLTASDGAADNEFGWSVSLFGDHALVGVRLDDDNGMDSGSAYIYDLDPPVAYRIAVLSTQVDDLYAEELLEKRHYTQLSELLDQAVASYSGGYLNNAIKSMQQFVDFATQLLALNRMPDDDAQSLIDQGQAIIDKIEEENGGAGKTESSITEALLQDLPQTFVLHQNHPNPFNPSTTIHFALPEQAEVRLIVYDMLGREVERLVDGAREAGNHEVTFDASGLPSGTFLYRLETPEGSVTQSMLLLK